MVAEFEARGEILVPMWYAIYGIFKQTYPILA
jgi:hypothetical protein